MFDRFFRKFLGSANERYVKQFAGIVKKINEREGWVIGMNNEELKSQTEIFKERIKQGAKLDEILVDSFAVVREAAKRVLFQRHYDVQLIGGMVLNNGMLAEMKTGEGKTLVATLPVYLNALTGLGVHVVTVNDYLASRDASWMGKIYNFLGLTVGIISHGLSDEERMAAYAADITYGTNHEFGFDYLRDNMKFQKNEKVMRPFNYAIVDEVDSILIDEARTPLIISGPAEDSSNLYKKINAVIPLLSEKDFEKDEKHRTVILTESGVEKVEKELRLLSILGENSGLYDSQNITVVHHVNASLKAHKLFARDVDYVVKDGEVVIIDEFTGRMMDGRRYSEGLHQAIEAKEHVDIQRENQTLATITYQNFFRLYPKLAGMGGTILTEEEEFEEIYKLRSVEIPTNKKIERIDHDDEVYLKATEKYKAVLKLIKECHSKKQPVLVGTTSIEKSEYISDLLKNEGLTHNVLNARNHESEAMIIANAGKLGAITIATNMAGRGTDIKLGGAIESKILEIEENEEDENLKNELIEKIKKETDHEFSEVKKVGGLFVIGTERHESRRIDNQLRGRAGRQGDPGASKFYISLEDDLMRIFGAGKMDSLFRKVGMKEDEALSHNWISKAIERAQKKVEAYNFDTRKHLLKFDDVMNDQRKVVYGQRDEILSNNDISEMINEMRGDVLDEILFDSIPNETLPTDWNWVYLENTMKKIFNVEISENLKNDGSITRNFFEIKLTGLIKEKINEITEKVGDELMRAAERNILLKYLDQHWKDHLLYLDYLRQGINLRAYAQSNPLNEYKREAFNMFNLFMRNVKYAALNDISSFNLSFDDMLNFLKLMNRKNKSNMKDQNFDDVSDDVSNNIYNNDLETDFSDWRNSIPHENYYDSGANEIDENHEEINQENIKNLNFSENFIKNYFNSNVKNDYVNNLMSDFENKKKDNYEFLQQNDLKKFNEEILSNFNKTEENLNVNSSKEDRNAPCFCGSGKRYKHCHGNIEINS